MKKTFFAIFVIAVIAVIAIVFGFSCKKQNIQFTILDASNQGALVGCIALHRETIVLVKPPLPDTLSWGITGIFLTVGKGYTNLLRLMPAVLVAVNEPRSEDLKCTITSGANFVSISSDCNTITGLAAGCAVVSMTHPDATNTVTKAVRIAGADGLPATCPAP